MLKIKDNVDLKELEKYEFIIDNHYVDKTYSYEFLAIDILTRKIFISSGIDEINGDKEITKLYVLIQAGLVEKVGEDNE